MSDDSTRIVASHASTRAGSYPHELLRPGEVLGHTYKIEALLGKGGMGAVYRATHIALQTQHAIKVILPEFADDPHFIALIEQEARALSRVRNDAVVEYQGLFLDERGRRYLVTEFVDGVPLSVVLRDRALEFDEWRMLRDRLATGLAAAHAQRVFHRDISPDNILLPGSRIDEAKIIDFGIAKSMGAGEGVTLIGTSFAGKFSFVSPEQVGLNGGQVDARSDIYSLGLVLAAAILGKGRKLPMGDTPASVVEARRSVPDLSSIPAEIRSEIARMLQPDPAHRPASMLDLVGAAAKSAPADITTHATKRSAARPILIVSGLVALAAAGGAGWYLAAPGTDRARPEAKAEAPPQTAPASAPASERMAQTTEVERLIDDLRPKEEREVPTPAQVVAAPARLPVAPPSDQPPVEAERAPRQEAAIPPTETPAPPPDPQALAAQILKQSDCATLTAEIDGKSLRLAGHAPATEIIGAIARLERFLPGYAVLSEASPMERPLCSVLVATANLFGSDAPDQPKIETGRTTNIFREGEALVLRVSSRVPYPTHVYVSLIDAEATVVHMLPTPKIPQARIDGGQSITIGKSHAEARSGDDVFEIAPPFGPNLLVAITSPVPLWDRPREQIEPLASYLAALQSKADELREAGSAKINAGYAIIETVRR